MTQETGSGQDYSSYNQHDKGFCPRRDLEIAGDGGGGHGRLLQVGEVAHEWEHPGTWA